MGIAINRFLVGGGYASSITPATVQRVCMLDAEDYFASRGLASYSKQSPHPSSADGTLRGHHFMSTGVWYTVTMIIEFKGEIFYWRGPAPFLFVAIPEDPSRDLKAISARVTYGWGVIPVHVRIGKTEWQTSLFPKDGRYLVPIRMSVQKSENLEVGDSVVIQVEVR